MGPDRFPWGTPAVPDPLMDYQRSSSVLRIYHFCNIGIYQNKKNKKQKNSEMFRDLHRFGAPFWSRQKGGGSVEETGPGQPEQLHAQESALVLLSLD